jgi:RHS repeat-associated protein
MAMAAFKPATSNGKITHTIHTDHLGGTNVVTDETGQPAEVSDYYPYGSLRLDDQAGSFTEQRKFTGHEYDSGVGLTYMGARHYDGTRGQFLAQDPAFLAVGSPALEQIVNRKLQGYLSDPQGLNSYSYARNNPLRLIDEDGEWFKEFATGQQSWSDFQLEAFPVKTQNFVRWSSPHALNEPHTLIHLCL